MFHGWSFWSLCWLLVNILTWIACLMGGWMLVREIHRQLRPPSAPPLDRQPKVPGVGP